MSKLTDLIIKSIYPNGQHKIKAIDLRDTLLDMADGSDDQDFAANKITSDSISSHEALASMLGYGFVLKINPETGKSELWVDGVHARDFFETLEMRYRKMIVSGEELVVNNGGVVSEMLDAGETFLTSTVNEKIVSQADEEIIWPLAAGDERLTFVVKGEAGIDYQQFVEDDILRYTWRDKDTGLKGASGYLLVRSAIDEFTYTAEILEGSPEWLRAGMTVALFGNVTNPDRQGFIVLSARERTIAIYDGVNSVRITPDNLKVLLGDLSGIVDPDFPEIGGMGLFSTNCALKGEFWLRKTGKNISSTFEVLEKEIKSKVSEKMIDANGDEVETVSLIRQTAKDITSKVSSETFDTLGERVGRAESAIEQTTEAIKSKVSLEIFNALGERVSSAESTIEQTPEKISLAVIENNKKLKNTGIDIDAEKIVARVEDKFVVVNSSGNELAVFNADGTFKSDRIRASEVLAGLGSFSASIRTPYLKNDVFAGSTLDLTENFNHALYSSFEDPITVYLPNDIEYNGTISILINVSGAGRKAGPVVLKNRIDDTVIGTLGPLGDAFMLTAIPMGGDNLIVRWAIINSFRLTW